ncbi:SurA N-terminal domain-containing protein [Glaciecola petra]|uniref:Periplasmic chaperone PpiD n=1 Tax=Glaciecola petra TaxID=3075602 RepID=A0ABU2ZUW9_9ALTE|nr:SurA N-terminal domain-containing protein [Aestuariibacter sp. P117]MDT0595838.1 SurA N-terminal domain-containing protein [Aestuariibacter sp. P117]
MLQNIREGIQGPWAIGIVALIVVSFVFTGVGSYISSSATDAVAIVNGEEISSASLEIAYENERARLQGQFGEAINSLFESESYINQFRQDILQRLIDEELVAQKASQLGLRVSDQQIKETIAQMPEFQVMGQFDNENYLATLSRAGFTPTEFAEYMREQMSRQQLLNSLNGSSITLPHQVNRVLALQAQTRSAMSVEIDIENYKEGITLSEDEIQQYYDTNITSFDTQEQVKLAYVTLSLDDLRGRVDVSDEEVNTFYQENPANYTSIEVREIAHILFELNDQESATVKVEAEAVLARLNQGEDFASLATEFSDDILSAEDGGNLGVLNVGDYDDAFESAAFAIETENGFSDVVETEFGFHIIKVSKLTPARLTPFEEVKEDILSSLVDMKAGDEFAILQSEMDNLAFEEPDSLEAVANLINKPVIETPFFENNQLPAGVNYPQVNDIAFSSELIDEGVNSTVMSLSDELVMVTRVAEHLPQRTQGLEEVRTQIEASLKVDKAQEEALAFAQTVQNAIFDQQDTNTLLAGKDLAWTEHSDLARASNEIPVAMVDAIFELNLELGNNTSVVTLTNGNVGLVKLIDVKQNATPDETLAQNVEQRLKNSQGQQMARSFVDALRSTADIQIIQ